MILLNNIMHKTFAEIEFRRFYEYSRLALNKDILLDTLEGYLAQYDLTYEDIKFKNEYVYGGDLDD